MAFDPSTLRICVLPGGFDRESHSPRLHCLQVVVLVDETSSSLKAFTYCGVALVGLSNKAVIE